MEHASCDDRLIVRGRRNPTIPENVSLGDHLYRRLQEYGDKVAQVQQVDGNVESRTFTDLLHQGKHVTNFFRQKGLATGDAVMICCANTLEFTPIMLGTLFLGGIVAPVNPMFDTSDMLHFVQLIQPAMVICNPTSLDAVTEAVSKSGRDVAIVAMETIVQAMNNTQEVQEFELGRVDPARDVAFVMCSSGTSGRPKGVEMIHSRIRIQMDIQIVKPSASASSTQPVILNMAGPYWVSCQMTTLISLHKGIKYVLLNGFTVESFLNTVQKFKVNSVVIGPDQVVALVKRGDLSQYDTSSLVSISVGGAPTPVAMFNALQEKLGTCMVAQVFGMTECMAVVEPAFGVTDRVGNVGKLVANADAKVVDLETGKLLGRNCPGEVWLRTTSLMKGYRNNPEATAAAIDKDGFLHTGDVGYFDEEGYLFIVDRIKELIKYKRDHVPPIEIEEVLLSHPDVKEAAVVGVFHEEDWEHATGVVVLKPGASATGGELLGLVEASLPQFKWLHGGIRFMDALPRTASGKINKKAIRDSLAQSK